MKDIFIGLNSFYSPINTTNIYRSWKSEYKKNLKLLRAKCFSVNINQWIRKFDENLGMSPSSFLSFFSVMKWLLWSDFFKIEVRFNIMERKYKFTLDFFIRKMFCDKMSKIIWWYFNPIWYIRCYITPYNFIWSNFT